MHPLPLSQLRCRLRSAFTLLELMVVLSIIAILIACLLPALSAARESAIRVSCQSHFRQIAMAVYLYAQDWEGYAPVAGYPEGGPSVSNMTPWWNHPLVLARGLVGPRMGDTDKGAGTYLPNDSPIGHFATKMMHCPGDPNRPTDAPDEPASYHVSYHYRQGVRGDIWRGVNHSVPIRLEEWPGEYAGYRQWIVTERYNPNSKFYERYLARFAYGNDSSFVASAPGETNSNIDSPWHPDGANYVYADGSVRWSAWGLGAHE